MKWPSIYSHIWALQLSKRLIQHLYEVLVSNNVQLPSLKLTNRTWKMVVGRLLFRGELLVSGRVSLVQLMKNCVVVWNICYFHPYLGKWSNLTQIFQMGWFNHQLKNTHLRTCRVSPVKLPPMFFLCFLEMFELEFVAASIRWKPSGLQRSWSLSRLVGKQANRRGREFSQMSNEKRAPGCLGCIGDEILPIFLGILISQYKDPYKPTSTMESRRAFFVAQMVLDMQSHLLRRWVFGPPKIYQKNTCWGGFLDV